MPTFLTTPKMDPALAARVEASVRGRRGSSNRGRRFAVTARLMLLGAIVYSVYAFATIRQKQRADLERTRAELLDMVSAHGEPLTERDRSAVTRAAFWLERLGGAYEGDVVADEVRSSSDLLALLRQPTMYVRSEIGALRTPADLESAAAASVKDTLLLCLVDPPTSRAEATLLKKVKMAYVGGTPVEERTANVHRLHDVIVGLPLLTKGWVDRVRESEDANALKKLRAELDGARLDRATRAAKSSFFLFALDEAGKGPGPTELDGERPHAIRLALVNVDTSRVLLRTRRDVDPSWISAARRPMYSRGLDDCALAFDVHEHLPARLRNRN